MCLLFFYEVKVYFASAQKKLKRMKPLTVCFAIVALLASCSQNEKKITVFSKGAIKINEAGKSIETSDGAGHESTEVMYYDKGAIDVKLITPRGNATVNIPDKGLFVLNAQKDTIVGSFISYRENAIQKFTPEDIVQQIDSLKQLMQGKNVRAEKKNFFIPPNAAVKVTDNLNAIIVSPFHNMKSVEEVGGKAPEVYRFYTTQEVRENIEKAKKNLDKKTVDSLNKANN